MLYSLGGLILSFQERFQGKKYPVCRPYSHQPDIKIGHNKNANAYRLYCADCDARAENAIPHMELSKNERENAGS